MLKANFGVVNSKTVIVNEDYWKKLPDKVKGVLSEVAVDYRDHFSGITMNRAAELEAADVEAADVEAGDTIVGAPDADRAAWANAMPNLAKERVKYSDAGFTGVRDWAKE